MNSNLTKPYYAATHPAVDFREDGCCGFCSPELITNTTILAGLAACLQIFLLAGYRSPTLVSSQQTRSKFLCKVYQYDYDSDHQISATVANTVVFGKS